jgi:hypothetical protein
MVMDVVLLSLFVVVRLDGLGRVGSLEQPEVEG